MREFSENDGSTSNVKPKRAMEVRLSSPRNPLEWIVTILTFGVILSLGIMLMGVVIVGVAVALVAAPLITWWRRRRGVAPVARPSSRSTPIDEPAGPIVDAEFDVRED